MAARGGQSRGGRLSSSAGRVIAAFALAGALLPASPALPGLATASAAVPAGFTETTQFSGLTHPTAIRFSPDGRVFVAEKSGLIKVFSSLSATTPTVVADLRTNVHNYWDRGLLGMTLSPTFPTDPSIYVLYTYDHILRSGGSVPQWGVVNGTSDGCPTPPGATMAGCVVSGRLSRLQLSGNMQVGPEQVLIEDWCQQFPSHSMGSLAFGADGMLYVSAGDGASFNYVDYGQSGDPINPCGDPPVAVGEAQTAPTAEGGALRSQAIRGSEPAAGGAARKALNGSILRVDPTTGAAAAGNPNANSSDVNVQRIIAHGMRNPFRITVRPGTNEIWVGDVGWNDFEEIDVIANGGDSVMENFGWPCYEGGGRQAGYDAANLTLCESLYSQGASAITAPRYAYNHSNLVVPGEACPSGSSSISGLAFYPETGGSFPAAYQGGLFFSDYSRDCIWFMPKGSNGLPNPAAIQTFVSGAAGPVELVVGPTGDLFYPDFNGGTIRRIRPTSAPQDPTARIVANPTSGNAPLTVQFDASTSSDPVGSSLTYAWDLDGDGAQDDSTAVAPSWQYTQAGPVLVTLRVTNTSGATATATQLITVNPSGGGTTYRDSALADGPVGYWRLGDTSATNATDSSGNGRVGTYETPYTLGATSLLTGDADPAVAFTGGRVTLPTSLNPWAGDFTIEAWVKPSDATRYAALFSRETYNTNGFRLGQQGNRWAFWSTESGGTMEIKGAVGSLAVGQTYHVVGVRSGTTFRLYVNGVEVASGSGTYVAPTGGGWISAVGGGALTGTVDEVAVYPTALSAARIAAHYQAGTAAAPPPPGAPVPTIGSPTSSGTWAVGDTISFSGSATDGQGNPLPASALSWDVVINHCPSNCHTHTLQSFSGVASGSFVAPDHGYPSTLEIRLTATSQGQSATTNVVLQPKTVSLTFQSAPAGLQLVVGATAGTAPFSRTVIQGSSNSVSAPSPQTVGGTTYTFGSWSDGGAATHNVTAGTTNATYTATFTGPPTVNLTFQSVPSGLQLQVNGTAGTTPFTRTVVQGSSNSVTATSPQTLGGTTYTFASWSDGGAATHNVTAGTSDATYAATYTAPAQADVSVTKTGVAGGSGKSIRYTMVVRNNGPSAATNVALTDVLPGGINFTAASASAGTCAYNSGSKTVSCSIGTMTSGATATVTLDLSINGKPKSVANTATVSTTSTDPSTGNNSSTVSVNLK